MARGRTGGVETAGQPPREGALHTWASYRARKPGTVQLKVQVIHELLNLIGWCRGVRLWVDASDRYCRDL